jgi:hypothetical protein
MVLAILTFITIMVYLLRRRYMSMQCRLCKLYLSSVPSIPDLVTLFMMTGQIVFGGGITHNTYAALLLAIVPFAIAVERALDAGYRTDIVAISVGGWGGFLALLAMHVSTTDFWLLLIPVGYLSAMAVLNVSSPTTTPPSETLLVETCRAFVYTMLWATSPEIAKYIGVSDEVRLLYVLAIVAISTRAPLPSLCRELLASAPRSILMSTAPISHAAFGLVAIGQMFSLLFPVSIQ